jgi:hypothetical protein
MSGRLRDSIQIQRLARDLRIRPSGDSVADIVGLCEQRVGQLMRDFPDCQRLSEVLECVASKVGTVFEVAFTDAELRQIREKYLKKGERGFTTLLEDLSTEDDLGVTIKLTRREPWEPLFASVIDCRGDKVARSYFTKWHEVAHLLTITDQLRLSFRRTHAKISKKDSEETLMDIIAGRLGFRPPVGSSIRQSEVSFQAFEELRQDLCPDASRQAALIGFVRFWPSPCLLISAKPGLRKRERDQSEQRSLGFAGTTAPPLRAIRISPSDAAREVGFRIFQNMRIPDDSVISRVFNDGPPYDEAEEDLSWWKSSDGKVLPARRVLVKARRSWEAVEALIAPVA